MSNIMSNGTTNTPKTPSVCVLGLGYIGLPTAAFIANSGYQVTGVDINESYVDRINKGEVPFFEPNFAELLEKVVAEKSLVSRTEVIAADIFIIAVPTPFKSNHIVDDSYIMTAGESIASVLKGGDLIVLESTSPPGMTERLASHILGIRRDLTLEEGTRNSVYFSHCPERVLPGQIMREMISNDRVIGGLNKTAAEKASALYSSFCRGDMLLTNCATAEMAKLTENAFRDVNIAFANELSYICDELDIDVWELIRLANHHPRVNILQPGPGVGGHCIAVDPWFIVSSAPASARLIKCAREVNDSKPEYVAEKIAEVARSNNDQPIALLGLAFKPNIDDLRESPAVEIATRIAEQFSEREVLLVEPNIETLPVELARYQNLSLVDLEIAISKAGTISLLVDHREFLNIDIGPISKSQLIDTRGIFR
ncbi:UDP-N-acetyl-D-mannosamine dehydrogenase [Corynebacterium sp. CCM 9186]|uniref:UDP-N-acetyl-D-mannosamine dehydrogenase n=1 Tax=Corynebacterium meridianum TaxID=2765363 RepID=UPI0020037878|nr:UDP-N-acetyl-D-mannosamine dehydrogenase [Corynebacterium meridianum]MCK7678502.1 UDP-N-acetyl-D-mannosamine dehydrogenase [Corynebacterium meridianum]